MKIHLEKYLTDFLSLLYPNLCIGCEDLLPKGSKFICPKCHYNLPKTNTHKVEISQFREKFEGIVSIRYLFVYCHFQKGGIVQKLLHELKYGNRPEIGELLGRWYGTDLIHSNPDPDFDLIVPVPLHSKRLKQRGYNQSLFFAQGLSDSLSVPVNAYDFFKTKNVSSQTQKSKVKRIKSVENSFGLRNEDAFKGKHLLLVDDVLTTGSTLISCAEVLLKAAPLSISIATIAAAKN